MRNCSDCGKTVVANTGDVENFMVRDDVWQAAGLDYLDGFWCVECLESRLGRPLVATDLDPTMPLNYPGCQRDTPRLLALWCPADPVGYTLHDWQFHDLETGVAWQICTNCQKERNLLGRQEP